jgi:acyl-CoA synthetase (AMP-forming)/AMP-acid ligase II
MFGSPAFGVCHVTIPKLSPRSFCEAVERDRVTHTVLVPTMLDLLTQFPDLGKYDLSSLDQIGYGGSSIAPDPQWGELVAACVVLEPGSHVSAEDLIAHCRRTLANYKVPRRIEFSDVELPKSGSGKILKRVLRQRYWVRQERAVS